MKDFLGFVFSVVLFCAFIYAMYWLAKTGSYFFFYEEMVKDTIREMVNLKYLNK